MQLQITITDREARMIKKATDGAVHAVPCGNWGRVSFEEETGAAEIQNLVATLKKIREISSRGDKMVYTKLINNLPSKWAEAAGRWNNEKGQRIEKIKAQIAQGEQPLDYFLDRKMVDNRVIVRLRPVNGKHGDHSLVKFTITPKMMMKLGKIEMEFEVKSPTETLVVPTMDIADEIVNDFASMWAYDYDKKNAARLDELKATLAAAEALA